MMGGNLVLTLAFLAAASAAADPVFRDATAETGLDFVHWNGMTGRYYFVEVVGAGGALFDADGDGDLDLYLVQGNLLGPPADLPKALVPPPGPLPLRDRLYRNDLEDGRLRFTDVTASSGLDATGYGMGAATGDVDNDGDVDLYVTTFGSPNQLWRNDTPPGGAPRFTEVGAAAGVDERRWSVPAVFFDADRDGWLDLFVGNYMDYQLGRNKTCLTESGLKDYCGPQSYGHEPDRFYKNRGATAPGTFDDASEAAGIRAEYGPALGAVASDWNGDGWLDVYVANDESPNQLWLARGGKGFVNDALLSGCALDRDGEAEASMGTAVGDFDGDGDEDLFLTHLTRQSNTLYVNDGRGTFRDRSLESGLANPSWGMTGFGTAFVDYDNDGWLDVFAANGAVYVLLELARENDPFPLHQANQLFRNTGDGRFADVTAEAGEPFTVSEVSRGALFGDLDNDGDTDVVLTNNNGPARVLLNEVGNRRPWIGLRVVEGKPPRDALGARVAVYRGDGRVLWRRVRTDGSYASANDPRIVVGLGDGGQVDKVEVHWLGGGVETWAGLEAGRYHVLAKGSQAKP